MSPKAINTYVYNAGILYTRNLYGCLSTNQTRNLLHGLILCVELARGLHKNNDYVVSFDLLLHESRLAESNNYMG